MFQILKVVVALLLALIAVALALYGIGLIGLATSGATDTAPSDIVEVAVPVLAMAVVTGGLAWALVRPRRRRGNFYRE